MSMRASQSLKMFGCAVALCASACSTGPKQAMTIKILTPLVSQGSGQTEDSFNRASTLRFSLVDPKGLILLRKEPQYTRGRALDFTEKAPLVDGTQLLIEGLAATGAGVGLGRSAPLEISAKGGSGEAAIYFSHANDFNEAQSRATVATPRFGATATPLADGRVLIVGGATSSNAAGPGGLEASSITDLVELYDPKTDQLMSVEGGRARALHGAVRLEDGRVAILGGIDAGGAALANVDLFDPATNTFSDGPALGAPRYAMAAAVIPPNPTDAGLILIVGGLDANGDFLGAATLDIDNATERMIDMNECPRRAFAIATPLDITTGDVLVSGGQELAGNLSSAEGCVFSPNESKLFRAGVGTDSMGSPGIPEPPRVGHTATHLGSGQVLVYGGTRSGSVVAGLRAFLPEIGDHGGFVEVTGTTAALGRRDHSAVLVEEARLHENTQDNPSPNRSVVIVGGDDKDGAAVLTVQRVDLIASSGRMSGNVSSISAGESLTIGRAGAAATTLEDGSVFVIGGGAGSPRVATDAVLRTVMCIDSSRCK